MLARLSVRVVAETALMLLSKRFVPSSSHALVLPNGLCETSLSSQGSSSGICAGSVSVCMQCSRDSLNNNNDGLPTVLFEDTDEDSKTGGGKCEGGVEGGGKFEGLRLRDE